jgi:hypothetical protein
VSEPQQSAAAPGILESFRALAGWTHRRETRAKGLITKALNEIENDVKNYEVFIEMLNNVGSINSVVEKITGMCPLSPTEGS